MSYYYILLSRSQLTPCAIAYPYSAQMRNTSEFFRLHLEPARKFQESLVRLEFNYVAENLLLRGGYKKTHFQADQTTLHAVSQMGSLWSQQIDKLSFPDKRTFIPKFTRNRDKVSIPEIFQFQELILQAVIRQHLSEESNLQQLLGKLGVGVPSEKFEVLGEKGLPEGYVDILIKDAAPTGISRKIIIEVKTGATQLKDLIQLKTYIDEIGKECIGSILIAKSFPKSLIQRAQNDQIKLVTYSFGKLSEMMIPVTFEELLGNFSITKV